ncbi:hypothetical protein [Sporosarcina sp. E16_8]|uniref:hypothetical protein n=1 Tax=Sporosarcina sp. E16_8 TaxID=2789295 RepID=UPI001A918BE7|nr:hypothetical protein [Sporosarcina sp. E16_8]MBO0586473.1 hypothetical protein [Sporosarcina sp. E16_8]
MTIDEAKKEIEALTNYIKRVEEYVPETFEGTAIKLYVELESVTKAAVELNEKGYKVGERKIISKDVSDLIRSKPVDEMHEMAQKMFKRNSRRSTGRGWL